MNNNYEMEPQQTKQPIGAVANLTLEEEKKAPADLFAKIEDAEHGSDSLPVQAEKPDARKLADIYKKTAGKKRKRYWNMLWGSLIAGVLCLLTIFLVRVEAVVMISAFVLAIAMCTWVVAVAVYWSYSYVAKKSLKTLVRTNKLHYAEEILSGNYRSDDDVAFSAHLLYDKDTNVLIAYDDIVMVTPLAGQVNIYTIDGKVHPSKMEGDTFSKFLCHRPKILVGDTPQNRQIYKRKVAEFKAQLKSEKGKNI